MVCFSLWVVSSPRCLSAFCLKPQNSFPLAPQHWTLNKQSRKGIAPKLLKREIMMSLKGRHVLQTIKINRTVIDACLSRLYCEFVVASTLRRRVRCKYEQWKCAIAKLLLGNLCESANTVQNTQCFTSAESMYISATKYDDRCHCCLSTDWLELGLAIVFLGVHLHEFRNMSVIVEWLPCDRIPIVSQIEWFPSVEKTLQKATAEVLARTWLSTGAYRRLLWSEEAEYVHPFRQNNGLISSQWQGNSR